MPNQVATKDKHAATQSCLCEADLVALLFRNPELNKSADAGCKRTVLQDVYHTGGATTLGCCMPPFWLQSGLVWTQKT